MGALRTSSGSGHSQQVPDGVDARRNSCNLLVPIGPYSILLFIILLADATVVQVLTVGPCGTDRRRPPLRFKARVRAKMSIQ